MNRNSNPKKTGRLGKNETEKSGSVKAATVKSSRPTKSASPQYREDKMKKSGNRSPQKRVSTSENPYPSNTGSGFRPEKKGKEKSYEKTNKKAGLNRSDKPKIERSGTDSREKNRFPDRFKKNTPYKRADWKTGKREKKSATEPKMGDGSTRLNKYISNAGICSRREADVFIENGVVTVNGKLVDLVGYKVQPGDTVKFDGRAIIPEKPMYLLLNKPKDYITTSEDPQGRRTVMALIRDACKERVFPVGRLDRNTTGLLLFTNDGEMADKLMHPKKRIKKIYAVELDKNLKADHLHQIREGVQLEDGFIKPDAVDYSNSPNGTKKIIGIEIHSGRNRIVRRIFEHLGYTVLKLDRVYFAGLTKKNLPRGKYRLLEPMEISMLKML
jgi:23S rRNA pseudouridine2605 synthase